MASGAYEQHINRDLESLLGVATPGNIVEFVVPAGQAWLVFAANVRYQTSATVGARRPTLEKRTAGGTPLSRLPSGSTIAASATAWHRWFAVAFRDTVFGIQNNSGTPMVAAAGERVVLYDEDDVDAAADVMICDLEIERDYL